MNSKVIINSIYNSN